MRKPLMVGLMIMGLLAGGVASSGQFMPAVVELFTSEGCSSCPPAEGYLGELAQRPDVLALAYHVDYWDGLGWRDRFALAAATERQRVYSTNLGDRSVYTPQVVINGHEDFVGSDRASIGHALARPRTAGVMVGLAVQGKTMSVTLDRQNGVPLSDILLVAYQRKAVTPIGRGENGGRTLEEFNIVRAFHLLGRWTGEPQRFEAAVDSLPVDATDVAVLVEPVGQGPFIGAASVRLR